MVHEQGVAAVPGLYMLGQTWQHTRTSALLGWVTSDAEFLLERILSLRASEDSVRATVAPGSILLTQEVPANDLEGRHEQQPSTALSQ